MFSLRCSVIHPKRLIREIINGPSSFCCFEQWTKISVEYVEPFFRVLVLQFNRVSLMPNSVPKYLFGSKNLRLSCFFDKIRKNSDWFWSLRPTSPARDSCALIRLVLIQLHRKSTDPETKFAKCVSISKWEISIESPHFGFDYLGRYKMGRLDLHKAPFVAERLG